MSNQWLLDEDRLRWPIETDIDLHAVLCLDDDNIPVRWLGVWNESQLPIVRAHVEQEGQHPQLVPVRIHMPDVFCDLSVARLSGAADVQLSQASFSIVGALRPQRAPRRRTVRRAN